MILTAVRQNRHISLCTKGTRLTFVKGYYASIFVLMPHKFETFKHLNEYPKNREFSEVWIFWVLINIVAN